MLALWNICRSCAPGQSRITGDVCFVDEAVDDPASVKDRNSSVPSSRQRPSNGKAGTALHRPASRNERIRRENGKMLIGSARISMADHDLTPQTDALTKAGCEKLFIGQASGARIYRPGLADALRFARAGDRILLWKLDRLGRSIGVSSWTRD